MPTIIILIIIMFFLIAISNAKIECIENNIKYEGFIISVLFRLFQTGGNSFLFNPLPVFIFDNLDLRIKKELIKKNYYFGFVVLLFGVMVLLYFLQEPIDTN
jgi:hypothetical protein